MTLVSLCRAGFLQAPECPPTETARTFGISLASSHPYTDLHMCMLHKSVESPRDSGQQMKFSVQEPEKWNHPISCGTEPGKDSTPLR